MSTPYPHKIDPPEYEVEEITGTIVFAGGDKVTFTLSADDDRAEGEQPWIGKSTDVRSAINEAMADRLFWWDGYLRCPNCDERVPEEEMNYRGMPFEMCDSCVHNAKRSGWEPPSEARVTVQQEAIAVLEKYGDRTDPNGYDGTPDDVVDEMAAVLRKVAEQTE